MRYSAGFLVGAVSLTAASFASAQAAPAAAAADSRAVVGQTVLNASQAQISGRVVTPNGNPLANATVRARNMLTGEIAGSTSTAAAGQFTISVPPGSYLLEVVAANGQIVGTSPFIAATAGSDITAVTVTVSAGAAATGSGLASLLLGTTTARTVTFAAATAGVAGVSIATNVATASPSR
jgi:hypothetical protein